MTMHEFDVADWKPVTHKEYAYLMSEIGAYGEGCDAIPIKVTAETLPDHRLRTVVYAHASNPGGVPEVVPYLMSLADLESAEIYCFERQSVELAVHVGA